MNTFTSCRGLIISPSRHDHHILLIPGLGGLTDGLDVVGAAVTERDEEHLVLLQVDDVVEAAAKADEGVGGEAAQEDGILAAIAEVFAGLGDFAEAFGVADVVGDDVGVHELPHCEAGVVGDVAAQVGGEHAGLHLQHAAVAHLVAEDGVRYERGLALFVGDLKTLAAFFC